MSRLSSRTSERFGASGLLFLLMSACASDTQENATGFDSDAPEPHDAPTPLLSWHELDEFQIETESFASDPGASVAIDALRVVVSTESDAWIRDPTAEEDLVVDFQGAALHAAAWLQDQLLVASSEDLYTISEDLEVSPLAQELVLPIGELQVADESLWIADGNGLHVWTDGSLEALSLDGNPITGPFATGAVVQDLSATWLAQSGLHAIGHTGSSWAVVATTDLETPSDLAMDGDDRLWVVHPDGNVHLRSSDGLWSQLDLPSPALRVLSHPSSAAVWLQMEQGAAWIEGTDAWPFTPPEGEWIDVDEAGRLMLAGDAGIRRLSKDRPLGLLGMPETTLTEISELWLDPTLRDDVDEVWATLDDAQERLDGPPWRVTLDPAELRDESTLVTRVDYFDGTITEVSSTLFLGLVTWDEDIEPLYEDRCARCHSGNTATRLDSADLWIANFEQILDYVSSGVMPQNDEPLTDVEVSRIERWRDGGFP